MRHFLFIFLVCCFALADAAVDSKLEKHIKVRCDWFNKKISLDKRIDCMTDYINCAVVGSGEIDLNKADERCLKNAAKRRVHEQQIQN